MERPQQPQTISPSSYNNASAIFQSSDSSLDDHDSGSSVLVKSIGGGKMAILNRPSALNALDNTVVVPLFELYRAWDTDPSLPFVLIKGNGGSFCAGGDVIKVYHKLMEGKLDECKNIFALTFTLIHLTSSFSKPYVAIWNGITIGSGSGISMFGTFRVATERTVFNLPETQIGFHPDAGASYYLPRLSGYLGEYLALTGDRLNGAEMLACGLATHYIHTKKISLLEEKLAEVKTSDPSAIGHLLDDYSETPSVNEQSILNRMETINECFGRDTLEEIVAALESRASGSNKKWCNSVLKKMNGASPFSLKVALRSIREGRFQTLEQCLKREYWLTVQAFRGTISQNFFEGVRTRLVNKTFAPKWNPSTLNQVSQEMVDEFFSPLKNPTEPPLELPIGRKQTSLTSTFRWKHNLKKGCEEEAACLKPPRNLLPAKL